MSDRIDYRQAFRDAKILLLPPQIGGRIWTDDHPAGLDGYTLERAQWVYDYVSKSKGEALLKDINMLRASRDWDQKVKGIPDGDPRRYPQLDLRR